MIATNFVMTVMWRKCNNCGYVAQDIIFDLQSDVTESGCGVTITQTCKCPQCGSKNLSERVTDMKLLNS